MGDSLAGSARLSASSTDTDMLPSAETRDSLGSTRSGGSELGCGAMSPSASLSQLNDISEVHLPPAPVTLEAIVRCRPLLSHESGFTEGVNTSLPFELRAEHRQIIAGGNEFALDGVMGPDATQENVYTFVRPIVAQTLNGLNGTVFAYGMTSAGKTYTMQGAEPPVEEAQITSQSGVIYQAILQLFQGSISSTIRESSEEILSNDCNSGSKQNSSNGGYEFSFSYMEIYNETCRDLLRPVLPGTNPTFLKVRESPLTSSFYVDGLLVCNVANVQAALHLVTLGQKQRTSSSTHANSASSRSHAIITLYVTQTSNNNQPANIPVPTPAQLNLVDLAGSERASVAQTQTQLKETRNINKSLVTLGIVIASLSKNDNSHINFRDSNLTKLLKNSFSDCSRTLLIACVSPSRENLDETLSTLRFACRAKAVRARASAASAVDQRDLMLASLLLELSTLKRLLGNAAIAERIVEIYPTFDIVAATRASNPPTLNSATAHGGDSTSMFTPRTPSRGRSRTFCAGSATTSILQPMSARLYMANHSRQSSPSPPVSPKHATTTTATMRRSSNLFSSASASTLPSTQTVGLSPQLPTSRAVPNPRLSIHCLTSPTLASAARATQPKSARPFGSSVSGPRSNSVVVGSMGGFSYTHLRPVKESFITSPPVAPPSMQHNVVAALPHSVSTTTLRPANITTTAIRGIHGQGTPSSVVASPASARHNRSFSTTQLLNVATPLRAISTSPSKHNVTTADGVSLIPSNNDRTVGISTPTQMSIALSATLGNTTTRVTFMPGILSPVYRSNGLTRKSIVSESERVSESSDIAQIDNTTQLPLFVASNSVAQESNDDVVPTVMAAVIEASFMTAESFVVTENAILVSASPAVFKEPPFMAASSVVIEEPIVVAASPAVIGEPIVMASSHAVIEKPVFVVLATSGVIERPILVIKEPIVIAAPSHLFEEPLFVAASSAVIEEPIVVAASSAVIEVPIVIAASFAVIEEPRFVVSSPGVIKEPLVVAASSAVIEEPIAVAASSDVIEKSIRVAAALPLTSTSANIRDINLLDTTPSVMVPINVTRPVSSSAVLGSPAAPANGTVAVPWVDPVPLALPAVVLPSTIPTDISSAIQSSFDMIAELAYAAHDSAHDQAPLLSLVSRMQNTATLLRSSNRLSGQIAISYPVSSQGASERQSLLASSQSSPRTAKHRVSLLRPSSVNNSIASIAGGIATESDEAMSAATQNANTQRSSDNQRLEAHRQSRWVHDDDPVLGRACNVCSTDFSFFRRRHHCRLCGCLCCSSCSSKTLTNAYLKLDEARVCDMCHIVSLCCS